MPYFPPEQETRYYCPNCKAWFIPSNISCTVAHSPGDCCHKYEKRIELTDEEKIKIMFYDKTIQEMFSTWMLKMSKCLKTGNVIGSIDWQKQAECRCEKCEEFFKTLREGKI